MRCWNLPNFPDRVRVDGRIFKRAGWKQPYPGVIAQYRADQPFNSEHLFVYSDRTFAIDHVDRFNPDHGYPIEHFLVDHPVGQVVLGGAIVGTIFCVLGAAIDAVTDEKLE